MATARVQVIAVILTLAATALLCSTAARTRAIGFIISMAGCALWFGWALGYGYWGFLFQQIALGTLSLCGLLSNLGMGMKNIVAAIALMCITITIGIPTCVAYFLVMGALYVWAALDSVLDWTYNRILEWKNKQ